MSTTRSDEDILDPRVTLSFGVPSPANGGHTMFSIWLRIYGQMALDGVSPRVGSLIMAGEWLLFEPHGPFCSRPGPAYTVQHAGSAYSVSGGVPRVGGEGSHIQH